MIDKDFLLGFLTFLLIILGFLKYQQQEAFYSTQTPVCIQNNQVSRPEIYKIKVLGAVKQPGYVYLTQWPPRVYEAIQAAGGLAEMADTSKIKPAESLIRAELVTIPFTFEEECRIIRKPEPIIIKKKKKKRKKAKKNIANIDKQKYKKKRRKTSKKTKKTKITTIININIASVDELSKLPGIGKKMAVRIIEERSKNRFSTPEDLLSVKGIGKVKLEKIKPYITF